MCNSPIFLQPNQFVLSQLLVIAQDTCVLIIKLPTFFFQGKILGFQLVVIIS